ncbi:MAG: hypothetical protein KDK78_02895 [Chlamydiia bacterium]|nr:hypothetical protein [Chlamydiia bacterium]
MRTGVGSRLGRCVLVLLGLVSFCACSTFHRREITSGPWMQTRNTYAHPAYPHRQVLNVLVLPVQNPQGSEDVELHRERLLQTAMNSFGKFGYFNLQYDPVFFDTSGPLMDLDTGFIDRNKLGAVGTEYNADAVLQISVREFRPYPPMRMTVKAMLVDTNTGERIWHFDHVFDTDDNDVVNLMRIWWNDRMAGGKPENRFEFDRLRPSVLSSFVFYTMAQTYGDMRWDNVATIRALKEAEACAR